MTVHVYSRLPALQSFCYVYTSNSQMIKPVQIYLPSAGSEYRIWRPLTKFLKLCLEGLVLIEGLSMNFCEFILLERISSNFRSKYLEHKQKKYL